MWKASLMLAVAPVWSVEPFDGAQTVICGTATRHTARRRRIRAVTCRCAILSSDVPDRHRSIVRAAQTLERSYGRGVVSTAANDRAFPQRDQHQEIERGIAQQRAADPGFAESLAAWLDRVLALYGERVLAFDLQTARRWSILSAALGNPSAGLMIAATALEHGLTIVTRNTSDFEPTGVPVLNPFNPRPVS